MILKHVEIQLKTAGNQHVFVLIDASSIIMTIWSRMMVMATFGIWNLAVNNDLVYVKLTELVDLILVWSAGNLTSGSCLICTLVNFM